ncbi:MAG: hypothetical protein ACFCD0_17110 [Gemmataceae bacterium]
MSLHVDRRGFVAGTTAVALNGLGDFRFLQTLPPLRADEVQPRHSVVRLNADMEPLVRFLETTPKNRIVAATVEKIRAGTTYQQLLGALLLAGVRNVRPRPVGFQFHTVLSVNSAHLASISAQDRDRWLPLLWAVDNFKSSEARDQRENNWTMPPVNESRLPEARHARERFIHAMDNWDREAADGAAAALVRSAGANEVIELFWRYGARDFRDIGHKAIFVANGSRALQTIGWRHAEPVIRSLADALLAHEGDNPARRNAAADVPYRENLERLRCFGRQWRTGLISADATRGLLATLRTANPTNVCEELVRLVRGNAHPSSAWDALFLYAGELLMRRPGIVGIHCVTTVNALHYAYQTSTNDDTRKLMLMQAAAFLPMFRAAMERRQRLRNDFLIDQLEPVDITARGNERIEEILQDVSRDRVQAARKTLTLLTHQTAPNARSLMAGARRLIFTKGTNSHDYKFSSAALEDFHHVTPDWRNRFLATAMFNLRGSRDQDNQLITQAKRTLQRRVDDEG